MTKKTKTANPESNIVRDFIEAADVSGNFLYRKDGFILTYLRIYSYNLNLLSLPEKQSNAKNLASSFKDDRKDFVYFTLPREIDLDKLKNLLKDKYKGCTNVGKRKILADMMVESTILSTSGENFEHQHFIKIWKIGREKRVVEEELYDRIKDFKMRYASVGIRGEILNEQQIIKLSNLYGNSLQASYESTDETANYETILLM